MKIPIDVDAMPPAQCEELSDELAAYYRYVLATHANHPETGTCAVCGVPRCPDWTGAYDTLARAHQLMDTAPPPWSHSVRGPSPTPSQLPTGRGRHDLNGYRGV
jgi:hypothetical protein